MCEVQSDKASVEITSRFAGTVKKLYYETGDMAKVGKPFVDIDIQGDVTPPGPEAITPPKPVQEPPPQAVKQSPPPEPAPSTAPESKPVVKEEINNGQWQQQRHTGKLATPAVRHLSKELDVDISQIPGTGKDGRVSKEDIYKYVERRRAEQNGEQADLKAAYSAPDTPVGPPTETRVSLTRTQEQMFKAMTRSLSIPHFLYADEVDFTSLVELRGRLNKVLAKSPEGSGDVGKLSYLPFIIKAVSMALYKYPILNSRVDIDTATSKPSLIHRSQHNIGVAMDTPSGLLVPVIKNVGSLNVLSIASELMRLQTLALEGKLSLQDMSGGTITVSNIGNIGGTYLSPVIVEREVAILGVGRMRTVPAFADDGSDRVVRRQTCNFSWSADHRVVDGATMARAAEVVRGIVEEPDVMVMHLR